MYADTAPPATRAPAGRTPDVRPARRWSRLRERMSPYAFISPFFLVFAVFGLFPMVFTFWVSLHDWDLIGTRSWVGFGNYDRLFADGYFWNSVVNTFGMFFLATIPQYVLALWLAHTLSRRIRMRTLFRLGVLVPNVTSVAAVAVIFSMIFARDFGFANWMLDLVGLDPIDWTAHRWSSWLAISVMVDWRWTGYNALIFLAAMQTIPKEIYEAAAIDGAGPWRSFWRITVPLMKPTLIFVVIISTIGGMQLFAEPLLFDDNPASAFGGAGREFQTLALYVYEVAFRNLKFGYAATITWVMFLIVVLVTLVNLAVTRRIGGRE